MSRNNQNNNNNNNNRKQLVPSSVNGGRSKSQAPNRGDLVSRAYNNQIIVKNEDGEYAPVG